MGITRFLERKLRRTFFEKKVGKETFLLSSLRKINYLPAGARMPFGNSPYTLFQIEHTYCAH
jgi:hypothetical protein